MTDSCTWRESDSDPRAAVRSPCQPPQQCLLGVGPSLCHSLGGGEKTWAGASVEEGPVLAPSSWLVSAQPFLVTRRYLFPAILLIVLPAVACGMLSLLPLFEGGSRTFCSFKMGVRAAAIGASCRSQVDLIRNSHQNGPWPENTCSLSCFSPGHLVLHGDRRYCVSVNPELGDHP